MGLQSAARIGRTNPPSTYRVTGPCLFDRLSGLWYTRGEADDRLRGSGSSRPGRDAGERRSVSERCVSNSDDAWDWSIVDDRPASAEEGL